MKERVWQRHVGALGGIVLGLGLACVVLMGAGAAGGDHEWVTSSLSDWSDGTMDKVDVWTEAGTARLDHAWRPNTRVNDVADQGKMAPSVTWVLSSTGSATETHFVAVWEDEREQDHYPDITFARSTDGGGTWSSDVLVGGAHQHNRSQNSPDMAARLADGSLWVVWQDSHPAGDDGDIYYATSSDRGNNWSAAAPVATRSGTQLQPGIVAHAQSGTMYAVWEDEIDDGGDIYVSYYNPDVDSAWSTPVAVSDDSSGSQQREPNVAADTDGNLYAVWEDFRDDPAGYDSHVYFSRWISGTTWGEWSADVRLSDASMDWAGDPDIVTGPGGVVYAAWYERVPTGPATYDFQIVVARSDDSGAAWSRSVVRRLHNASAFGGNYGAPALGVNRAGLVHVAWVYSPDQQAATANVLLATSPDRGQNWTEPRTLNRPANHAVLGDTPAMAAAFDGQVVVAWQDYRESSGPQIYAAGYPADRYAPSGEYSRDLNTGGPATWGTISWTATITPGSGLALATRVMVTPGAGWTEWMTHTASGESLTHPQARFIEYRAVMTSTGATTPVLNEVVISYQLYRIYLPIVLSSS
jgi:hypothetical protein